MEKESFVMINDKQLHCIFCGSTEFNKVKTLLNKKWAAIFDAEAWSPAGLAYICTSCGYKHEFFKQK